MRQLTPEQRRALLVLRDSQPALMGPDSDQHLVWAINLDAEYLAALG